MEPYLEQEEFNHELNATGKSINYSVEFLHELWEGYRSRDFNELWEVAMHSCPRQLPPESNDLPFYLIFMEVSGRQFFPSDPKFPNDLLSLVYPSSVPNDLWLQYLESNLIRSYSKYYLDVSSQKLYDLVKFEFQIYETGREQFEIPFELTAQINYTRALKEFWELYHRIRRLDLKTLYPPEKTDLYRSAMLPFLRLLRAYSYDFMARGVDLDFNQVENLLKQSTGIVFSKLSWEQQQEVFNYWHRRDPNGELNFDWLPDGLKFSNFI